LKYRYLRKLKNYVRNKAHAERSIAEKYLADECLTFCSRYLHGIETKFNRVERNLMEVLPHVQIPLNCPYSQHLDDI